MEEKKIILVEDDLDHADLITEALVAGDIGTEIILVQDGMEALDYFQEFGNKWNGRVEYKIKLIIIDLNLPKVSGMDILKFLKMNSKYSKIPVIVLSTSSDQKTIDEAYKNKANGYFVKPASYEEFVEKVKILKKCCEN
ncbi:MAG: response regulator [Candidatus Scalindua sp.]